MSVTKTINGKEYTYHHCAMHRGYHTVKGTTIEEYNGRYGKGYKEHSNNPHTTKYHNVVYWIKRS